MKNKKKAIPLNCVPYKVLDTAIIRKQRYWKVEMASGDIKFIKPSSFTTYTYMARRYGHPEPKFIIKKLGPKVRFGRRIGRYVWFVGFDKAEFCDQENIDEDIHL